MIADIRKLIAGQPFVPFTIHSADGMELTVPTVDHVAVPPAGGRVFVFGDDEGYEVLFSAFDQSSERERETSQST